MRRFVITAALAGALAIGTAAHARPFDQKTIAASAKWVLHVDVDAVGQSQVWKMAEPKLQNNPQFVKARKDIERIAQVRLPDDLHDITLYGPSFGEKEAVIVIRSAANDERLKTLISLNETYVSKTVGGQTVHSWEDKGKHLFAGFAADRRVVIGQSQDAVVGALDVLAGKMESIKSEVLVPNPQTAGVLMYIAGDEIARLAGSRGVTSPRSAVVQHLDNA
ncbi:MAG: hypothetical protein H7144_07080, partial [Burkholderiales bacterium]|nr:hypothetical protein [Phycisphaerae bacterium]